MRKCTDMPRWHRSRVEVPGQAWGRQGRLPGRENAFTDPQGSLHETQREWRLRLTWNSMDTSKKWKAIVTRVGCYILSISQGTGQRPSPSEYFADLDSLKKLYLISYATFFAPRKGSKLLKKKYWLLKSLYLLNLFQCCFCLMFCTSGFKACGILALQPGIKPIPLALEGEVLTTGHTGKSCLVTFFVYWISCLCFPSPL